MKNLWPITLKVGDITLRPLRMRDRQQWNSVRAANRDWLTPWESTVPLTPDQSDIPPSYRQMIRFHNSEAKAGRSYSFAIFHGKNLIGQITLGGVMFGALRGGHIGYWIDRAYSSRGYTTDAVNVLTTFAFTKLYLHRIEINIRPENAPSIRVAEKAGYHFESERPRFLHIDGQWRDHVTFVKINDAIG